LFARTVRTGESSFENASEKEARAYVRDGHIQSFGSPWNEVAGKTGPDETRDDKCGEKTHTHTHTHTNTHKQVHAIINAS